MSRSRCLTWLAILGCAWGAAPVVADMAFPGREWEEATPESQGLDAATLAAAVKYLEEHSGPDGVKELVIVRNGRLVWGGPDIDRRHGVWSVTKSFTSTVLGLLIDDGKCGLDTRASSHAPGLSETFPEVTLRHFTTMTSGYRAVGDEPRGTYRHGPSQTPFEPGPAPLFSPPGSKYAYWDSAMNEFAEVLTRIAGEPIEDLFRRRIADPIGMSRERWDWGDFGEVDGLVVNGGSGNNGKHVQITAREIARLGHLFLNRGAWEGKQLISAAWVETATSVHVPASLPWAQPESGIDGRGVYGFNWWANGVQPDGSRKWPGAPTGTFAASGYNNNDLFVIPEWRMVVARLGLDESRREITDAAYGAFLKKVGEALRPAPETTLSGWTFRSPRDEIAPRAWRDEELLFEGAPTLAVSGKGLAAANGRWTASAPVEAGSHYRFATRFRSRGVDEPLRSILARILWRDARGGQVLRAEYPATTSPDSIEEWGTIRQTYEVPASAVSAEIELIYRWDADGTVHFGGTRLERVDAPPPRRVRLASVHHRPRNSEGPRRNLEAFAALIARAAEKRADIVCLPEGITVAGTGKSYTEVSEPVPGPSTRFLGEVGRRHDLYIVAGIYERDGPVVYNTAVLLDPEGQLAGKYRKVCLPREEIEGGITPGDSLPVFDTRFGRIGMMICWDVFFPEPARRLARQGAEVIFLPIWGGNLDLARARAIENQVYLVSSTYDMKTAVFDREGAIRGEGTDDDPVVVVEVDLAERQLWPWLGDFKARIPREMPAAAALHGGALAARDTASAGGGTTEVIPLFNGRDLDGLYTWLQDSKYEDPDGVFTVEDGMLRIAGRPHGYIATRESYSDYRLVVEFKWGERTYGAKYVRNSGILVHAVGPDGGRRGAFMSCIECQLAQGCVGDFIVIRGEDAQGETIPVAITSDTVLAADGRTRWSRAGRPTVYSGKQFWWSDHDPEFEELIDTSGRWDVESPLGEWTRVEIIARGSRITVIVNDRTVNECYGVHPSAGKILLQSEGFEIWFRKFELYLLGDGG